MKLPCFFLLLAVVVANSRATNTNVTTYWNSKLQGVLMPPSIKGYLPTIDDKINSTSQFVTSNPNISEDVNIFKCHATKRPPKMTKIDEKTSTSLHFLEKDLSNINNNNVHLYPRFPSLNFGNGNFLPRSTIDQFPALKSVNLPVILARFSISSNSTAAKMIKHTIELCEYASKDENICVTSLESMIDFVQSTLVGHVIQAFSTIIMHEDKYYFSHNNSGNYYLQPYRIIKVKRLTNSSKDVNTTVSCHKAQFPFAVFLCHQRSNTVPYMVTLEGLHDKTRIEAATACHMDTSEWDPRFPGLVALKATPGTPVCHFLNQRSVLWVVGGD